MERLESPALKELALTESQLRAIADWIGADPEKCRTLEELSKWYENCTAGGITLELLEDGYLTLVATTPTTRVRCEGDIALDELHHEYIWEEVVSALVDDLRFYDLPAEEREKDDSVSYEHVYRSRHFDAESGDALEDDDE